MYERVDTSSTVEIEQDPVVMVGLILVCAAFVAVAVSTISGPDHSTKDLVFGWVGIVFFGFGLVVLAVRLLRLRGPALTVSPQGLMDRRTRNPQLLPWSDVRSVGEWRHRGQRMVILGLSSEAKERLAKGKPLTAIFFKANVALGADGLAVTATGLKASFHDIQNLITAFANAHANLDQSSSSRPARQS